MKGEKIAVTILLDVWASGHVSTQTIQPFPVGTGAALMPKPAYAKRYRVIAYVDDPTAVDADAPATVKEEP